MGVCVTGMPPVDPWKCMQAARTNVWLRPVSDRHMKKWRSEKVTCQGPEMMVYVSC